MLDEYRRIFGDELSEADYRRLIEDAYRVALRTSSPIRHATGSWAFWRRK